MTDPNQPKPAGTADAESGAAAGPAGPASAAPRDPTAVRDEERSGVETAGGTTGADPDALDQSVGRGDAGNGDAPTRNEAI